LVRFTVENRLSSNVLRWCACLCICLRRNDEGIIGYTPDLENIQGGLSLESEPSKKKPFVRIGYLLGEQSHSSMICLFNWCDICVIET